MKKSLIIASTLLALSTSAMASDTFSVTFSGTVQSICNIVADNASTSLVLSGSETAVKIFDYTIDNNSSSGFTITLSSTNNGKLVNAYNVSRSATFLDYTVDIVPKVLGGPNTVQTLTGLSLSTSQTITYVQDSPTVSKVWDVNINHASKNLFTGIFSDTITLTISNI